MGDTIIKAANPNAIVDSGSENGWYWREWSTGFVEIWFHGQLTLTTAPSIAIGGVTLQRSGVWIDFPHGYTFSQCACMVSGMEGGAWYECGGVQNEHDQPTSPYTKFQVLGYKINAAPPTTPTNINVYICGNRIFN